MITALKDWVRNLIIIVAFANIFELLLPDNGMRKYVKVVMGFFILLTLLNPLLNILDVNLSAFSTFRPGLKLDYQGAVSSDNELYQEENRKLALQLYQEQVELQMKSLILNQIDLEDVWVDVQVDSQTNITSVRIRFIPKTNSATTETPKDTKSLEIKPIKDVKVNVPSRILGVQIGETQRKEEVVESELRTQERERFQERTRKLLMSFYNLKQETISFL